MLYRLPSETLVWVSVLEAEKIWERLAPMLSNVPSARFHLHTRSRGHSKKQEREKVLWSGSTPLVGTSTKDGFVLRRHIPFKSVWAEPRAYGVVEPLPAGTRIQVELRLRPVEEFVFGVCLYTVLLLATVVFLVLYGTGAVVFIVSCVGIRLLLKAMLNARIRALRSELTVLFGKHYTYV